MLETRIAEAHSEAQAALVSEVKAALGRALALPESQIKHVKVQALTGLICTMIESCMATAQQVPGSKVNPGINNMVRIMIKKGVVTDLARVPHSLDLSSPNVATTVNAVLRPLETLSRIVNQPSALGGGAASQKPKPKNSQNNQASLGLVATIFSELLGICK